MKHPTSCQLHAYWNRLRGERASPERGEIEPGEIRNLLADSLILELEPARRAAAIRLAGTRICALFGRELRGTPFADLWGEVPGDPDGAGPWRLIETVAVDTVGLVAGLKGTTAVGDVIELELLLLPLRHRGQTQARMLGALSPHRIPSWHGIRPVKRLDIASVRVLDSALDAVGGDQDGLVPFPQSFAPPANDTKPLRRGHLLVHRGGRG